MKTHMETAQQSEIFFLISSIGFVILGILFAVFLFYLIRALNTFSRILSLIEKDVNQIGDATKEILEDVRDSSVFRLILGKRRRASKKPE